MRIEDATILITGATGGIGQATARRLSARGAKLVLQGRNAGRLDTLARTLGARTVPCDLSDPDGAHELVERCGAIDVLVCAAGYGVRRELTQVSPGELDRLVDVNLRAPIHLARAFLPQMLARGSGHLAFVASIAALAPVGREAVYAATKAGLVSFAASLRLELAGSGVGVSTVSPGAVDTGFWQARGVPYHRSSPRPISPERVAARLVHGIETDGGDRVVPAWLRAAAVVQALSPRAYDALTRRLDPDPPR